MNKNKTINKIYEKKINTSLNSSSAKNKESILLTDRNLIPRRSNYSFYYCPNKSNNNSRRNINNQNIMNNKINNNNINKISSNNKIGIHKGFVIKNNSKKKVNNLPMVQRRPSRLYNESSIIKIQSIVRGYLLNKKLDKYLRYYIQINNAIQIIEKIFTRKIFHILKENKNNRKNYKFKNIYYSNKSQNASNNIEINIELQSKINELINEKKELQNNYENLKEFIKKYKELEIQNRLMRNEISKLKQKNNELLKQINQNKNPLFNNKIKMNIYKRYIIQKQNDMNINIISPKRFGIIYRKYDNLNKEIKQNNNNKDFFTLGSDGRDNEEIIQEEKIMNKLRILFNNKENKIKFILFKAFIKFYYNGLFNIMNIPLNPIIISNSKSKANIISRRYNSENSNNLINCMSIKTLSETSSIFTDKRPQNLEFENKMRTSNFLIEEENKRK